MLWDRKIGKDSVDNRYSHQKLVREAKLESILLSKKPFTALHSGDHFYIPYRIGGARSENIMLKQLRVSSYKETKGPVDYFRVQFKGNSDPIEYDIRSRTSNVFFHCLCLPYLSIEGNRSNGEDSDQNDESNETRAMEGCLASIIDFQHHKVYNGKDFVLPIVWSKEMETDESTTTNTNITLGGTVLTE